MDNLIRKYKLYKLLNIPLTDSDEELFNFIKGWLKYLTPYTSKEYPYAIFFNNDKGTFVLGLDIQNKNLIVRYNGFWSELENRFKLNYVTISFMVAHIVKEELNINFETVTQNIPNSPHEDNEYLKHIRFEKISFENIEELSQQT